MRNLLSLNLMLWVIVWTELPIVSDQFQSGSTEIFPGSSHVEKSDKTESFFKGIHITNHTEYDIEALMNWFFHLKEIEDVFVRVSYLKDNPHYDALVIQHHPKIYFIGIKPRATNYKLLLLHELIHVNQYVKKDLEIINSSTVNYKGEEIDLESVEYKLRKFEVDAHRDTHVLLRKFRAHSRDKSKNILATDR